MTNAELREMSKTSALGMYYSRNGKYWRAKLKINNISGLSGIIIILYGKQILC